MFIKIKKAKISDLDDLFAVHHEVTLLHEKTIPKILNEISMEKEKEYLENFFERSGKSSIFSKIRAYAKHRRQGKIIIQHRSLYIINDWIE